MSGGNRRAEKVRCRGPHSHLGPAKREARKPEMSKQAMRDETERLVKEALERKTVTVKQGKTRIETKCGKCGAPNRVSAAPGEVRVAYTCKECGDKQRTL
jgi:transposase-like protein